MVAATTVCCYTHENVLCQTTRSMLNTVEPKSVVVTLLCPKFIVFDLHSHIVQGKWLVLNCFLFGGFTRLEGNIGCQILRRLALC